MAGHLKEIKLQLGDDLLHCALVWRWLEDAAVFLVSICFHVFPLVCVPQAKADTIDQLEKFRGRSEPTWLFLAVSWYFLTGNFNWCDDGGIDRTASRWTSSKAPTPRWSVRRFSMNWSRRNASWLTSTSATRCASAIPASAIPASAIPASAIPASAIPASNVPTVSLCRFPGTASSSPSRLRPSKKRRTVVTLFTLSNPETILKRS